MVLGAWEEEEADIMGKKHLPLLDRGGASNSTHARRLPAKTAVRWAAAAETTKHHDSVDAAVPLCLHPAAAAPPTPATSDNLSWSTWLQVMQCYRCCCLYAYITRGCSFFNVEFTSAKKPLFAHACLQNNRLVWVLSPASLSLSAAQSRQVPNGQSASRTMQTAAAADQCAIHDPTSGQAQQRQHTLCRLLDPSHNVVKLEVGQRGRRAALTAVVYPEVRERDELCDVCRWVCDEKCRS